MCGKNTQLLIVLVEGTQMNTCNSCSRYGKVLKNAEAPRTRHFKTPQEKPEILIVPDIATRIRTIREQHNMTQAEFAAAIGERESLIPKVENGHLNPPLTFVKKVERKFKVKLTEEDESGAVYTGSHKKGAVFTLGDFINVKK